MQTGSGSPNSVTTTNGITPTYNQSQSHVIGDSFQGSQQTHNKTITTHLQPFFLIAAYLSHFHPIAATTFGHMDKPHCSSFAPCYVQPQQSPAAWNCLVKELAIRNNTNKLFHDPVMESFNGQHVGLRQCSCLSMLPIQPIYWVSTTIPLGRTVKQYKRESLEGSQLQVYAIHWGNQSSSPW